MKYIGYIALATVIVLICNCTNDKNGSENNVIKPDVESEKYHKPEELFGRWVYGKNIVAIDSKNVKDSFDILLYFEFQEDSVLIEDELVIRDSGIVMNKKMVYGWRSWLLMENEIKIMDIIHSDGMDDDTNYFEYDILRINKDTLLLGSLQFLKL